MNAADLTFGVEIECTLPGELSIEIGGYKRGIQVPALPAGWKAERDSSIEAYNGRKGCEIVSPVLKGAEGLRQLMTVLAWLRSVGAKVNRSCGFHVHVGFNVEQTAELGRVVALVARHEKALYAVTGTKSRENSFYCRPIKNSHEYEGFKAGRGRLVSSIDRYFTLNLRNLATGTKPTVEFRVFSGTLDTVKAIGYVRLCLGLVERAIKVNRSAAWDLTKSEKERKMYPNTKPGRFAAMKLVYCLGWKRVETTTEFGAIVGDGLPTTDEIVKELYRLASKYDGPEATDQG